MKKKYRHLYQKIMARIFGIRWMTNYFFIKPFRKMNLLTMKIKSMYFEISPNLIGNVREPLVVTEDITYPLGSEKGLMIIDSVVSAISTYPKIRNKISTVSTEIIGPIGTIYMVRIKSEYISHNEFRDLLNSLENYIRDQIPLQYEHEVNTRIHIKDHLATSMLWYIGRCHIDRHCKKISKLERSLYKNIKKWYDHLMILPELHI